MNTLSKSSSVFAEAKQYIPGGVNSPVRSFRSVGGNPPFITRGEGSKLYDLDGNNYIDYVLSYGPLSLRKPCRKRLPKEPASALLPARK